MLVMQEIKLIDKIEINDTCNYIILFKVIVNLQLYIYIYLYIYIPLEPNIKDASGSINLIYSRWE